MNASGIPILSPLLGLFLKMDELWSVIFPAPCATSMADVLVPAGGAVEVAEPAESHRDAVGGGAGRPVHPHV